MQTERPNGFTLVELMVVIAIVGILASIAAPQYRQYMRQATVTGIKSATAPIKTQIESCYSLNNGPGLGNVCNTVPVGAPVVRGQVTSAALIRAANSSSVFSIELVPGAQPQIKVNPFEDRGILATDVYYLTGSLNAKGNGIVSWLESGPMCDKGYC